MSLDLTVFWNFVFGFFQFYIIVAVGIFIYQLNTDDNCSNWRQYGVAYMWRNIIDALFTSVLWFVFLVAFALIVLIYDE